MSKKEKLIKKLRSNDCSISFDDVEALLVSLGYEISNKGKTSGSRISFTNSKTGTKIILHKPHPQKELKGYQIKQIKEHLEQEGLI